MTKRQGLAELAEALVPENHVRLLYISTAGLRQVTGRLTVVTPDLVHVMPHQPPDAKARVVARDRVHSAIVTRTGPYTARLRAAATQHLQRAAIALSGNRVDLATREIAQAVSLVPGLGEEVPRCTG